MYKVGDPHLESHCMPLCLSKDVYFQRIFLVFHAHISHDLGFALFEIPCPLLSLVCIAHEPLEPRITSAGGSCGVLRSSSVEYGS